MALNISLNATPNATSPLYDGKYTAGNRPALRTFKHGDAFTISGNYGNKSSVRTFLGGATGPWETTAVDATPANITNWAFDNTLGFPVVVKQDPVRGKVIYGHNTEVNYNACIRYSIPGGIPENTNVFTTHLYKTNVRRDGLHYALSHQCKHFRFNGTYSVEDTTPDIKWHTWEPSQSNVINTSTGLGVTDSKAYAPKDDNQWCRMEFFFNTGTQNTANGRLVGRIHYQGVTSVIHLLASYGSYCDAIRHTCYLEQYYFGNFNGHVMVGTFNVGLSGVANVAGVANNYVYAIASTGYLATYTSSANATEMEILIGIRDAVKNNVTKTHDAYISGNTVYVTPIDPNDITSTFFFNANGSANSVVGNPYYSSPKAETIEDWRDDQCVQVGSAASAGWERVELRSAIDEANSTYREQQVLASWTTGGISGNINTGGLPKGRHDLYLCALSDVDAAGKDVVAYSELVTIIVN